MTTKKTLTREDIEEILGYPFEETAHQCHAVSLAIVQSGVVGPARVARGWCNGVLSQHSWVIRGNDAYSHRSVIIDATLWSYRSDVEGVWTGTYVAGQHHPHGHGSIWDYGPPKRGDGPTHALKGFDELSGGAKTFLEMCGELDVEGWSNLAHMAVEGWPAKEIITAMYNDPQLGFLIPIDIVGMVTDLNPQGLYR